MTSLIGAGGGFVIVPALSLSGGVLVKEAVGSALLVICATASTALASYYAGGEVEIHWDVVAPFSASVAVGAFLGSAAVSTPLREWTINLPFHFP